MKLHNSLFLRPSSLSEVKQRRVNINMKITHCGRTTEGVGIGFVRDKGGALNKDDLGISMLY